MNLKNLFKIMLIFLILCLSISFVNASQDFDYVYNDLTFDDCDEIEDYDSDLDSEFEDDLNSEDDYLDDDGDLDEDDYLDDDGDLDEDDYLDDDLDFDVEDDYPVSDFEFLTNKIILYLEKYVNTTDNLTQSQEFLDEYQKYLSNPSVYLLNNEFKSYNIYLKIYDSITSSFPVYNLTENETEYLKFMIIFYLNHYGNISENYTWNESDEFFNFVPDISCVSYLKGFTSDFKLPHHKINYISNNIINSFNLTLSNNGFSQITIDLQWFIICLLFLIILLTK